MARIRGLLFDKDGTLFDFQATWGAWCEGMLAAESRGDDELASRLALALGYDPVGRRFQADSVIAAATETMAAAMLPYLPGLGLGELAARLDARAAGAAQIEAAPLVALMARLSGMGLALGVATNDTSSSAIAHLRAAGVEGAFGFIACHDSGFGRKPEAGQLLAFAAAVGLAPGDCAMVGDSLHDLHAARAAGMRGVAVLTGLADRAELAAEAEVVLNSIADLPEWVLAQG